MPEEDRSGPTAPPHGLPNKMGRIVFQALEQEIGRAALNAVLRTGRLSDRVDMFPPNNFERGFSFDEMGQLFQALEEMYGPRSGQGLARRAGQNCFRIGVKDFGPALDLVDIAVRVLPLATRLRLTLEVLSQMLNRFADHRAVVEESERYYYWGIQQCSLCWGRHTDSPCCHLAVGLLEESTFWLSSGRRFYIEEIECIAAGDERCLFQVAKEPLEE